MKNKLSYKKKKDPIWVTRGPKSRLFSRFDQQVAAATMLVQSGCAAALGNHQIVRREPRS